MLFPAAEQLFREAINDVLMDDSFKLPYNAKMAVETALQLRTWMDEEQNT